MEQTFQTSVFASECRDFLGSVARNEGKTEHYSRSPVVPRIDYTIVRINHPPVDGVACFVNT